MPDESQYYTETNCAVHVTYDNTPWQNAFSHASRCKNYRKKISHCGIPILHSTEDNQGRTLAISTEMYLSNWDYKQFDAGKKAI